ncbi:MAG: hypothetical protein ACREQ3_15625 [Candidatus Binatia bacterium]
MLERIRGEALPFPGLVKEITRQCQVYVDAGQGKPATNFFFFSYGYVAQDTGGRTSFKANNRSAGGWSSGPCYAGLALLAPAPLQPSIHVSHCNFSSTIQGGNWTAFGCGWPTTLNGL